MAAAIKSRKITLVNRPMPWCEDSEDVSMLAFASSPDLEASEATVWDSEVKSTAAFGGIATCSSCRLSSLLFSSLSRSGSVESLKS